MQNTLDSPDSQKGVKNCTFSTKRHDEIQKAIHSKVGDPDLVESIMQDIRRILHFNKNNKQYDERKKQSIYEYRARLKKERLKEIEQKTT